MFIAALFTIAKIRKQPKCPSTDEQIKKMWNGMEYYSTIKQNKMDRQNPRTNSKSKVYRQNHTKKHTHTHSQKEKKEKKIYI